MQLADNELGLSSEAARKRLVTDGHNRVSDEPERPLRRFIGKLWAPVPWMLEAAIVLQLVVGEDVEAAVIAFLLLFNAALSFFQEGQAQSTLNQLKASLAISASVRRDGAWQTIGAEDLVVGDVVKLSLGAIVPADVRLSDGNVLVDQSMLTGESVPIEAVAGFVSYEGALIRRGEAVAEVTATGERTKFGRSAELIRTASVESSEQQAIFKVVRNLAFFNGGVTALVVTYAAILKMPVASIVPLLLVAVLASIPVALPSMFTLAAAVGARALGRRGVLPTQLASLDEASSMDVLCADKTGTLTKNELAVTACKAMAGFNEQQVMAFAALASSDGGMDPVDAAIRKAAAETSAMVGWTRDSFTPFDPANKRSEAQGHGTDGAPLTITKGAFSVISGPERDEAAAEAVAAFEAGGSRVIVVAAGAVGATKIAGVIALSDPPRPDAAALIAQLRVLGVRTVMATGDSAGTARVVADAVGIVGDSYAKTPIPATLDAENYAISAGILPEDKDALVKVLQKDKHVVGMCGDGANDAPALRQAQLGIAVSTATDVAKSAAGMVLTAPGLAGIVAAVEEGRRTFQRVLTYTLRSIIHKIVTVLFLMGGLILTRQAILTPVLMIIMMVGGDFLSMSSSTDNVRPSAAPNVWNIRNLTIAGLVMGACDLLFCLSILGIGHFVIHLGPATLQTLAAVTLVFSGQAVFYVVRERRRMWASPPGRWLIASSIIDLGFISFLALRGILMAPLSFTILISTLALAAMLAFVLDSLKVGLFKKLAIA